MPRELGDFLDVGRARALFGLFGFKRNLVAFAQIGESNANEGGSVEKHVLVAAVRGDKTKALVGIEALDDTGHIDEFTNNFRK